MDTIELLKEYLEYLFTGNRQRAKLLIDDLSMRGYRADKLLLEIIWPAMEQVEKLSRQGQVPKLIEQIAVRINRMMADQLQRGLIHSSKKNESVIITTGKSESSDLGGQILADLFEKEGWTVWFIGSDVPDDELVKFADQNNPSMLLLYGTLAKELPTTRRLIALFREIGICEDMQIMACGGVFDRVPDLIPELRVDLFAKNALEALDMAYDKPERAPVFGRLDEGRRRKIKRKKELTGVNQIRQELETAV